MRPPKLLKPYVISFCRSVVLNPQLVYVPTRPVDGPVNKCFSIVPNYVSRSGGEQVFGWAIWEWPRVLIEAEFHAVWRQSTGGIIDISPKQFAMPRILFLPDPRRRYTGRQVDNIRKPLDKDPAIKRFCDLCSMMYREQNRGELAQYHGPINYTEAMDRIEIERQALFDVIRCRYGANSPEIASPLLAI